MRLVLSLAGMKHDSLDYRHGHESYSNVVPYTYKAIIISSSISVITVISSSSYDDDDRDRRSLLLKSSNCTCQACMWVNYYRHEFHNPLGDGS